MVKGSGMIAPQLATMLCVITTDAAVGAGQLQAALNAAAADHSFNRIDVDGCMSTNDTVHAARRIRRVRRRAGSRTSSTRWSREACASLARQIIGDGEGARHDVRITVTGATSGERGPGLRPRGRGLEPAQVRHLRATTRTGAASSASLGTVPA